MLPSKNFFPFFSFGIAKIDTISLSANFYFTFFAHFLHLFLKITVFFVRDCLLVLHSSGTTKEFSVRVDDTMTALHISESSLHFPSELDVGIVRIVVSEHDGVPCVVSLEDFYFDG